MNRVGLIDRWIEKLSEPDRSDEHVQRLLRDKILEDLAVELRLAEMISAEAQVLPYAHLREKAMDISEEKRLFAEKLLAAVPEALADGTDSLESSGDVQATGQFREVLALEVLLGEQLSEHAIWAEDIGLTKHAKLLLDLKEKHYQHQEEIERLIMKINTSL